jgi:probable O-glycosylation ligase (exosortase A-associated)
MLRTTLVFLVLVPGVVLALTSRLRALWLYLWFGFFRPQEFAWGILDNLRLSYVLGLLLVVPAFFTGNLPNVTHPLSMAALLFLATGLVAQHNALDQATGWQWIQNHGELTLVILLAITLIKSPRDWLRTMAVPVGCLAFYGAKAGFASLTAGGSQFAEGLGGAFMDNNAYAVAMVMIMPLLWILARNVNLLLEGFPAGVTRFAKFILYAAIPLCAYTLTSTFSRGGFLGLVAAFLAFTALQRIRKAIVVVVVLAALLPVVASILPSGYLDRLSTIKKLQEDVENPREDVSEGRIHIWGVAVDMVQHYPLGIGMRNFPYHYFLLDPLRGAYGARRDVHSSHFQALAEHGFLGGADWIFLNLFSLVLLLRIRRRAKTPGLSPAAQTWFKTGAEGLITSFAGFLVGGATISMALNDLTWLSFALVASLDIISAKMCREVQQAKPVPAVAPAGFGPIRPVGTVPAARAIRPWDRVPDKR